MTYPQQEGYGPPQHGQHPGAPEFGADVRAKKKVRALRAVSMLRVPVIVAILGIAGFFFGFGRFVTVSGVFESPPTDASFFETNSPLAPVLLLIAGLTAAVGYVTGRKWGIGASAAVATSAVLTQLCGIVYFSDRLSAGWAYWVVLAIALVQAAFAVSAVLSDVGLNWSGREPAWPAGVGYVPQPYGPGGQAPYGQNPQAWYPGQVPYDYAGAPAPFDPRAQFGPPQYGGPPRYGQPPQYPDDRQGASPDPRAPRPSAPQQQSHTRQAPQQSPGRAGRPGSEATAEQSDDPTRAFGSGAPGSGGDAPRGQED